MFNFFIVFTNNNTFKNYDQPKTSKDFYDFALNNITIRKKNYQMEDPFKQDISSLSHGFMANKFKSQSIFNAKDSFIKFKYLIKIEYVNVKDDDMNSSDKYTSTEVYDITFEQRRTIDFEQALFEKNQVC
ncbi:hypothetical protein BpHYR1_006707 [Brachionus plicatilis]|uniref:Uncharacterized protein n=1 Tax=Brachionus plicatilis TaxID=10195 RepID=A0A3M7RR49_BRAPC|nr:hypothetical protein BpHYR1_006707 [Brachionus plicatilis]